MKTRCTVDGSVAASVAAHGCFANDWLGSGISVGFIQLSMLRSGYVGGFNNNHLWEIYSEALFKASRTSLH